MLTQCLERQWASTSYVNGPRVFTAVLTTEAFFHSSYVFSFCLEPLKRMHFETTCMHIRSRNYSGCYEERGGRWLGIQMERAVCALAQWSRRGRVEPERVSGVKVYF